MRRRSTLALVGLATSALLLTACSSGDSGDTRVRLRCGLRPASSAASAASGGVRGDRGGCRTRH